MFIRPSTILFSAIALAGTVAAAPNALEARSGSSQCNTGSIQCCNSVQAANSTPVAILAGLLGIDLSSITGQVGITCSPLSAVGLSSSSCTQQPVCCTGNSYSGLVVIGCSPITL